MMNTQRNRTNRIGIYSGAFDPVHAGHITFALQAVQIAKLREVRFLPERLPRHKQGFEHYAHRIAMLNRATRPHPKLCVQELPDTSFTVRRTLPRLRASCPLPTTLVLLVGSDVLGHIPDWPFADTLLRDCEVMVGLRSGDSAAAMKQLVASWRVRPKRLYIIRAHAPEVSSTLVRRALSERLQIKGALTSVRAYAAHNWLYVNLST